MFYRKDLLKSNFELNPYLTVLPEYCGLGLGLMKKRAVAELTVMTSMRARVSMVRGCMLLAGHHPPHWCRCHHASCDMSGVGPGPGHSRGTLLLSVHTLHQYHVPLCQTLQCSVISPCMRGPNIYSSLMIFTKASCLKLKD